MRPKIELKEFNLSVQASKGHYCKPREYLEDINKYTSVEIAIFDKDGNWVKPRDNKKLMEFPRIVELLNYYESGDIAVGVFVPIGIVEELIEYLKN